MDKTHIIRRVSSTPENFIMYKTLLVLVALAVVVLGAETQDQETAEQFYRINGFYPSWYSGFTGYNTAYTGYNGVRSQAYPYTGVKAVAGAYPGYTAGFGAYPGYTGFNGFNTFRTAGYPTVGYPTAGYPTTAFANNFGYNYVY